MNFYIYGSPNGYEWTYQPGPYEAIPPAAVSGGFAPASVTAPEVASEPVVAAGLLRRPLRDRLAQRLVDDAVAKGADRAKAEAAVADLVSDRPILDWLLNGGWEQLLALVLKLISLLN